MKYLAFDIEAANGYMPSSICSIGVVLADEHFDIVERRNIWINPKTKYNLNGTRENVGIDLHLDKALLDSSPDFSQVYHEIKRLLTMPDTLVVGHAVDADVRMLNAACDRYGLPGIDFRFVCTQLLFRLYKGEKDVRALNKIAAELGIGFAQHNSEEDAYMSMCTLRYLVADSGLTVDELLDKYNIRYGTNVGKQLTRSVSLAGQVSKRRVTQAALSAIRDYMATSPAKDDLWQDKVFAVARSLELSDNIELWNLVKHIAEHGGRYTSKLAKCNFYIKADKAAGVDIPREKRVAELAEQGALHVVAAQDVMSDNV